MNWEIKEIHIQSLKTETGTLYKLSATKRKGLGDTLLTEQTDKESFDLKTLLSVAENFFNG